MKLTDLFSLQGTLFAMMLIGAWLKKRGIIDEGGTDAEDPAEETPQLPKSIIFDGVEYIMHPADNG